MIICRPRSFTVDFPLRHHWIGTGEGGMGTPLLQAVRLNQIICIQGTAGIETPGLISPTLPFYFGERTVLCSPQSVAPLCRTHNGFMT